MGQSLILMSFAIVTRAGLSLMVQHIGVDPFEWIMHASILIFIYSSGGGFNIFFDWFLVTAFI